MNPRAPINSIPRPEIFTIVWNSVESGFFVILKTLLHSIMKDFNPLIILFLKLGFFIYFFEAQPSSKVFFKNLEQGMII